MLDLYEDSKTNVYNCYEGIQVFDFNGEIVQENNPIVTQ